MHMSQRDVCMQPKDELHHSHPDSSCVPPEVNYWLLSCPPSLYHCFFCMVTLVDEEEIREAKIPQRGRLDDFPLSINHWIQSHSDALKLTQTHTPTASATGWNIITVRWPIVSLLNSRWNNVSGIIPPLSLLFGQLWRGSTYTEWCHLSPRTLLKQLNLSTLIPSASEWWRTLSQRFVEADLLAAVCEPYPFRHLALQVAAVLPHAACGRDVSVDSKPGSLSELKVVASCSLVWPSRLTTCLPGWLMTGHWLTSLCVWVSVANVAAAHHVGLECKMVILVHLYTNTCHFEILLPGEVQQRFRPSKILLLEFFIFIDKDCDKSDCTCASS